MSGATRSKSACMTTGFRCWMSSSFGLSPEATAITEVNGPRFTCTTRWNDWTRRYQTWLPPKLLISNDRCDHPGPEAVAGREFHYRPPETMTLGGTASSRALFSWPGVLSDMHDNAFIVHAKSNAGGVVFGPLCRCTGAGHSCLRKLNRVASVRGVLEKAWAERSY